MTGQWETRFKNRHSQTRQEYTRFETYDKGASIPCVMNGTHENQLAVFNIDHFDRHEGLGNTYKNWVTQTVIRIHRKYINRDFSCAFALVTNPA